MAETNHYIFLVDQGGIAYGYRDSKSRIVEKGDNHVSLLYFLSESEYLFKNELRILHSHFPDRFLFYFEESKSLMPGVLAQEMLESIISENTRDLLHFSVQGEVLFCDLIMQYLSFLGIEDRSISTEIINQGCLPNRTNQ
jgi:hypothetical protein